MTDITHLRTLLAAATPGPWCWDDDGDMLRTESGDTVALASPVGNVNSSICIEHDDAALIVASVNSLPALLAVVEAAVAMVDKALMDTRLDVPGLTSRDVLEKLGPAVHALTGAARHE